MTSASRPVRTRFAPSPTGYLHIGGARTALFSWAFARRHGGKFILRIEDTDVARSTPEAVQAILDGMAWLDLSHDEGPFYQMQRMDRYKEVIQQMLTAGTAYRFCRENEALYRPHPEETDVASRAMHELFRRRGITIADSDVLLKNLPNPVVGMFSTGILEAAVRGIPAWVHLPGAPDWVEEFWDRYGLRRFGSSEPSPAPQLAVEEPASLIAQVLEGDA